MAVDSVANPYEPEASKPKYPCLMTYTNEYGASCVVLFRNCGEGVVVNTDCDGRENYWKVGQYVDCWNMGDFKPFHGQVVLTSNGG